MLIKGPADIPSSEITPERIYLGRREFLAAAGAGIGIAALGDLVRGAPAAAAAASAERLTIAKRMVTTTDTPTSYPAVTSFNNFYEFGTDPDKTDAARNSKTFKPRPWSVAVDGLCARPGLLTLEDLLKPHPLEERVYRLRCVEGWSMVIPWVGFPLADLLKRFEPASGAKYVEFTTVLRPEEMPEQRRRFQSVLSWPYVEGLRIDEAMHPLTLMAVGVYGETLPNQNGAPLRLVVPWKYGFKSIKSIVKIRFVDKEPLTSWVKAAPDVYGFYSNINPNVRISIRDQHAERRIGEFLMRKTLMFNGYADQVASLYKGMDLQRNY